MMPERDAAFTAARAEQQKIIQAHESYGPPLCVLGLIDAGLGQKEEALREGRRAVELLPVEKDPINGIALVKYLAMIAAWVGDKDLACEQLAIALRPPSRLTYGELKLLPFWDPLRGDPRFEKIVASLAPTQLEQHNRATIGLLVAPRAPLLTRVLNEGNPEKAVSQVRKRFLARRCSPFFKRARHLYTFRSTARAFWFPKEKDVYISQKVSCFSYASKTTSAYEYESLYLHRSWRRTPRELLLHGRAKH